jgi:VWFA-related protein
MHISTKRFGLFALFCLFVATSAVRPQDRTKGQDDVVRISTELVQTEVMVFDRRGHPVTDLKPEQFELTFNGQRRSLSFFDRVFTGSAQESTQILGARNQSSESAATPTDATQRGRLLFFFLDDIHLSPASITRARNALNKFVDESLNPGDQVAVVSTSGQIGFLQQLSDNPAVLHLAIARLSSKPSGDVYTGKTQVSDYMASQVLDYGNRELFAALLESTKVEQQMGPGSRHGDHGLAASYSAVPYLRNRLRQINAQAQQATQDTFAALESLIESCRDLPGRKTVFFLSDGFTLNERRAGALNALENITRKAAAAGVIVYTMDARGTTFNLGSSVDASANDYWDASARRTGLAMGELEATRAPLKLIADETGGRAIFNLNSIDDAIRQTIDETSQYYLLAWRPDSAIDTTAKRQMRVAIRNHPEFTVRWRSDFGSQPRKSEDRATDSSSNSSADQQLKDSIKSTFPTKLLPVSLSLGYLSAKDGEQLKVSMQIERQYLEFKPDQDRTDVDVLGLVIDDRGEFASFKQLVTVAANHDPAEQSITWNQQMPVKPGIYQVRIALRDRATGLMGGAMQWIEVPNTNARFVLSSVFLGERKQENETAAGAPQSITVDVDHRFRRSSVLRFQTYIYNSAHANGTADVWIDAKVLSNRRPIMSVATARVPNIPGDALPYWAEIPLQSLRPGQYTLSVSATDRAQNRSSTQQVNFSIE